VPSVVDETAATTGRGNIVGNTSGGLGGGGGGGGGASSACRRKLSNDLSAVNHHDSNLLNLSRVVHHLLESRELLHHLLEPSQQILIDFSMSC